MQRGHFILFEGGDRCGKTTQATRLVRYLNDQGHPSVSMAFPCRTTYIGSLLDKYLSRRLQLDAHSVYLLFLANRWERVEFLHTHLSEGINVVVDRFSFSGVAYSELDFEWCVSKEHGLPLPDLTLLLRADAECVERRGGWGLERFETPDFQTRVNARFHRLKTPKWREIDASESKDAVTARVREIVGLQLAQTPGPLEYMC
jgi:dTMP kinase